MEKLIPRIGLAIFIFKQDRFLIGCRKGANGEGTWSVPGGHLEFGETIIQGSKREVEEETGLKIKNIKIAGLTNDLFPTEQKHYVTIWLTSDWSRGKPQIKEPDKFLDMKWTDFSSLPKNLFLPWRQLLKTDFFQTQIKSKIIQP